MFELVSPGGYPLIKMIAASGGVYKGQLVKLVSAECAPITAAVATQIIVGLCLEDADAGEVATIAQVDGQKLRIPMYGSSSKKTIAAADYGKQFDINVATNEMTIDLDDTTNGFLFVVDVDPVNLTCDVIVSKAVLLL
jgi:hypothetical protein